VCAGGAIGGARGDGPGLRLAVQGRWPIVDPPACNPSVSARAFLVSVVPRARVSWEPRGSPAGCWR
jgi:hypothetical protein